MFANNIKKIRLPLVTVMMVFALSLVQAVSASAKLSVPTAPTLSESTFPTAGQPFCAKIPCPIQYSLSWTTSPAIQQVTSYKLFKNGVLEQTFTATAPKTFATSGPVGQVFNYTMQAVNSSGSSPNSNTVTVNTSSFDDAQGLSLAANITSTSAVLKWDYGVTSRDGLNYANNVILRCQVTATQACANQVQFYIPPTQLTYTDNNLTPFTQYSYRVYTMLQSNYLSNPSNTLNARTLGNKTTAPTAPVISQIHTSTPPCGIVGPCPPAPIGIGWNASPLSDQISSYKIYRDGILINIVTTTEGPTTYSYIFSGTTTGTSHVYWIQSTNNFAASAPSNKLTIVTP